MPPRVCKVGHPGDVPDTTSIDAVAADAVAVVKAHYNPLFLFGAPHPVPSPVKLTTQLDATGYVVRVCTPLAVTMLTEWPEFEASRLRVTCGEREQGNRCTNERE